MIQLQQKEIDRLTRTLASVQFDLPASEDVKKVKERLDSRKEWIKTEVKSFAA